VVGIIVICIFLTFAIIIIDKLTVGTGGPEAMSVFIICRPMGNRRYLYFNRHHTRDEAWRPHPGESFGFPSKEAAEEYTKVHKEEWGFTEDDFVRPYYEHDNKRCQYCTSPAVRQVGMSLEHPKVTIDFVCNSCNVKWQNVYLHDITR
jgi:hypothetical protein